MYVVDLLWMHGAAIFYLRDSVLLILIMSLRFWILDVVCPYGYLIPNSSVSKSFENLSTRPTYFQQYSLPHIAKATVFHQRWVDFLLYYVTMYRDFMYRLIYIYNSHSLLVQCCKWLVGCSNYSRWLAGADLGLCRPRSKIKSNRVFFFLARIMKFEWSLGARVDLS